MAERMLDSSPVPLDASPAEPDVSPAPLDASPAPLPHATSEAGATVPAEDPTLSILEAVSRGEISVDEALALLRK